MTLERNDRRAANPDQLVQMYSGDIWRFATSQVAKREDAEDVVMEVFGAAIADFRKVERADDQRLWLLGVARRKVADSHRRNYRRAEQPISAVEATTEMSLADDSQMALRRAMEKLPDEQREALVLKYVNGLSTEEVATVLRRSVAATNSLLQRARQSMRATMGPLMVDPSGGEIR